MTSLLRIASIAFNVALVVAVPSGIVLLWFPTLGSEALARIIGTSFIVLLASGLYIAVCDALTRIKANRQASATSDNR